MPHFILNKLIRDKLRGEYARMGQTAEYRTLSPREHTKELIRKVIEEVREIPVDGTGDDIATELADVQQAVEDLMTLHGITPIQIQTIQDKKYDKKGGFIGATFVESLDLKDDDEWVQYYRSNPDVFTEVSSVSSAIVVPYVKPGIYQHYKGQQYEVIGVALDSETTQPVVIYRPLYKSDVAIWTRPYNMFIEDIIVNDKNVARFSYIEQGDLL